MSNRSNVCSLLVVILTCLGIVNSYTLQSVSSTSKLTALIDATESKPSLASGSDMFVASLLYSTGPQLILAAFDTSTDILNNNGDPPSSGVTVADDPRVAVSGNRIAVVYVQSGTVKFELYDYTAGSASLTLVKSVSIGSGTLPWVVYQSTGNWIVLYRAAVTFTITLQSYSNTGTLLTPLSIEAGSAPSMSASGSKFVISYSKLVTTTYAVVMKTYSSVADGTMTLVDTTSYGSSTTAPTSRVAIAPSGSVITTYIPADNNIYYVVNDGSNDVAGPILMNSAGTVTNPTVAAFSSNLFVALWQRSGAIESRIVSSNGTTWAVQTLAASGSVPAVATLASHRFVAGWIVPGTINLFNSQHWALQYCGDGFVTSNEVCDSGPYCQTDCTCPAGSTVSGTGCTAPPVPPTAPPTAAPTATPTAVPTATPTAAPVTPPTAVPSEVPIASPIGTPIDSPIESPVAAPVGGPLAGPVSAPVDAGNTPIVATPSDTPTLDVTNTPMTNETLVAGLPVGSFIAALVVPVVVTAVAMILLIVLLRRRKRQRKGKSGNSALPAYDSGPQTGYSEITLGSQIPETNAPPKDMSAFTVDERLHIPYADLKFSKEIGSGAFGKVFIGDWQRTKVALKLNMMAQGDDFEKEARLMLSMRPHPNVVEIYGISSDGPHPVMIIEFCEGGSLDSKLYKDRLNLPLQLQLQMISGIAKGLLHLHRNKIVHRDLAARNILLSYGKPKISDFGMSRQLEGISKAGQTKTTVGPIRWMAPESLSDLIYSPQSDVWSFGCVVYEIISKQEPHAKEDLITIGIKIRDQGYTPVLPKGVDPFIKKLLKSVWQKDPAKRPTMEQVTSLIDEHLAKVESKSHQHDVPNENSSSPSGSPLEASHLEKSRLEDSRIDATESRGYDDIKDDKVTPVKVSKKDKLSKSESKEPKKKKKDYNKKDKVDKNQVPESQREMIQDDPYDEIGDDNKNKAIKMQTLSPAATGFIQDGSYSDSDSNSTSGMRVRRASVPNDNTYDDIPN